MHRLGAACLLLLTRPCFSGMPHWHLTSEELEAYENGRVPTLACEVRRR